LDREEALVRINTLIGKDLRAMAAEYNITVMTGIFPFQKENKGWAGHVIERFLGLPLNSSRAPNFGSWELKVVPLRQRRDGSIQVKETMAITMIDPVEVAAKDFEDSHLYLKLCKQIVVGRLYIDRSESSSTVYSAAEFDLDNPLVYAQVKADYDLIRATIIQQGFDKLSGKMGKLVQPRTKGPGHGSTSRAFYARTAFVAHILGLIPLDLS
jgi:DNA mismatch repair protein MutH